MNGYEENNINKQLKCRNPNSTFAALHRNKERPESAYFDSPSLARSANAMKSVLGPTGGQGESLDPLPEPRRRLCASHWRSMRKVNRLHERRTLRTFQSINPETFETNVPGVYVAESLYARAVHIQKPASRTFPRSASCR
jgi:hypothetical protein